MVEAEKIVPSSSTYGALVLFANNKGGDRLGFCIDYRLLNANTVMNL